MSKIKRLPQAFQPRRARDQQADIGGLALKRDVLERLSAIDPEPEEVEPALLQIINAIGLPTGPTRAICLEVKDEWETVQQSPEFVEWLLRQAIREGEGRRGKGKRRDEQQGAE
ncbi:MAG: hypothetical protein NVS4B8_24670 [Herpetosiphon sp.]